MPFTHRKTGPNKVCVYKKDTGEKVGCTTPGNLNKYLAELHIHSKENRKGKSK
jgi:hypothetical protein